MKIKCGNCQKIMNGEEELKRTFPEIPDLLDRISPGEPVPIGECPECGALVHAEDEQPVKWILESIHSADILVVADSPYLDRVETELPTGDPNNEVLRATWHDVEGLEYEVRLTEAGLAQARIMGHTITAQDHEGTETNIELFRLAPINLQCVESVHSIESTETSDR